MLNLRPAWEFVPEYRAFRWLGCLGVNDRRGESIVKWGEWLMIGYSNDLNSWVIRVFQHGLCTLGWRVRLF